ncbi:helix-turn-helix domain-containing protein [Aestuariibacter sp. A3R04]|uniref:helix-turn-helix domain-containing protein n=1 Tax=Aestuariibacter sp. A3R04 TaxID=2841571 RepID=UPI002090A3E3|nr:helix-turn-helix domain-containing protein [Aestuariibacter sp. A3R04]
MSYKYLIEGQLFQNEAYLWEDLSYREIGQHLKVNHSTISREVRRNRIRDNHYLLEVPQAKIIKRRCLATKHCVPALTITFVEFGLSQKWSFEQITGVGKSDSQFIRAKE